MSMFFLFASIKPCNANCPGTAVYPRQNSHLWENKIEMNQTPWTRNRSTWMWVAIAAVAFTSVAHAETALQSSKSYTHPVLEFLARSQSQNPAAFSGVLRFGHSGSRRHANAMLRNVGSRAWVAMLPVFFVGLVSPLSLASAASIRCLGHAPASPLLPDLFQRPPPCLA
jgi:hypothetical protein